jgi:hypothetical protein
MNYENFEQQYKLYEKILNGLTIPSLKNKKICDLSLNEGISAEYLIKKFHSDKIYTITKSTAKFGRPVIIQKNISNTLSKLKFDFIIGLTSTLKFSPVFETIQNLHKSLNVGGKFIFAVYPDIYDERGTDILNSLSLISENPIKERLVRWTYTLNNGFENIFYKVELNEILHNTTIDEIINLFKLPNYFDLLFDDEEDFNMFFKPFNELHNRKFTMSWNILKGIKL